MPIKSLVKISLRLLVGLVTLAFASTSLAVQCLERAEIVSFRSHQELDLYEDIAHNLEAHLKATLEKLEISNLTIALSFQNIPESLSGSALADTEAIRRVIEPYRQRAESFKDDEETARRYLAGQGAMQLYSFTRLTEDSSAQSLVFLGSGKGALPSHYQLVSMKDWRDPDSLPDYADQFSVLLLYGLIQQFQGCDFEHTAKLYELLRVRLEYVPTDSRSTEPFRDAINSALRDGGQGE